MQMFDVKVNKSRTANKSYEESLFESRLKKISTQKNFNQFKDHQNKRLSELSHENTKSGEIKRMTNSINEANSRLYLAESKFIMEKQNYTKV